jgi:hypothetical protein
MLLPSRIGIQSKDERVDVSGPRPTPALHAIDRQNLGDTRGQQCRAQISVGGGLA